MILLAVAACGRGPTPEVPPSSSIPSPEHLESAPVAEESTASDVDSLVANVERSLAAVESAREQRAALDRDLEEWRERARRLEEQIRVEREESEDLRARLVALEERLRDPEEKEVPTGESAVADQTPPSSIDDSELARNARTEAEEDLEAQTASTEEEAPLPSGGGLFGLLWRALFGGDREVELGGDVVVVPATE